MSLFRRRGGRGWLITTMVTLIFAVVTAAMVTATMVVIVVMTVRFGYTS